MNLVEKYYVGIQGRKSFDTIDFPLGFATPYGTDVAFRKRKDTVDHWSGPSSRHVPDPNNPGKYMIEHLPPYNGVIIDNEPMEGFRVEKAVSRWSTSNKLFRINDPRGFTLEISSENLADLILNTTLVDGVFQEKLVWTRNDSNNYLTRLDHPEYQANMNPKFDRKPIPGDLVSYGHSNQGVYCGKLYAVAIDKTTKYYDSRTGQYDRDYPEYGYGRGNINQTPQVTFSIKQDPKPWEVIYHSSPTGNYESFTLLRGFGKNAKIKEVGKAIKLPKLGIHDKDVHSSNYTTHYILFKTKEEMLAATVTEKDYE